MKILHVADFLPEYHTHVGGAEYVARRIIDEQVNAGIEVEVATLPVDFKPETTLWQEHHTIRNLDRFFPKLAYIGKQYFMPQDPIARYQLRKILEKSRPDIVHYHNLHFSGLSVLNAAQDLGIPSVFSVYDYWIFCPSFMLLTSSDEICQKGQGSHCVNCIGTTKLSSLKSLKQQLFGVRKSRFARAIDGVDKFIVLSEASQELLAQHGIEEGRTRVIPQYIWNEAVELVRTNPPEKGRLVYVGWVESRKGLHVVIAALGLLAKKHPELTLEVLGLPANLTYKERIEAQIERIGLSGKVRFREKLSRSELLLELQRAFLVTIPEQWENMSPVILTEAMAAGACVLASRIGGIGKFVTDFESGLLANHNDENEFAEKIDWAMENYDIIQDLGNAARERAKITFSPLQITANTIELYRSLMACR